MQSKQQARCKWKENFAVSSSAFLSPTAETANVEGIFLISSSSNLIRITESNLGED